MKQRKQPRSKTESKAAPALAKIPTGGQRRKLDRMHRYRRQAVLRRMENGISFSAAENSTKQIFDTVGWNEVLSRLYRARGIVFGIGSLLTGSAGHLRDAGLVAVVRDLAKQIGTAAAGLSVAVPDIDPQPSRRTDQEVKRKPSQPYATVHRIKASFVIAQLRAARAFVAKCQRNAPHIEARGGAALTAEQGGVIDREIRRIQIGVSRLKKLVRRSD